MKLLVTLLVLTASIAAQTQGPQHLFVVNKNGNTLSIVNTRTFAVDHTVNVGNGPHEVAISPDGAKAYVANAAGNSVSVVDLKTRAEKKIASSDFAYPHGIIFTPDGRRALVTSEQSKKIVIIDAVADTVLRALNTDQEGVHMAVINKAGTWAYFTNRDSNTVSFMDLRDYKVVANIPVGQGGEGIALSPDEKEIWVGDRDVAMVSILDVASRRRITTLPAGPSPV